MTRVVRRLVGYCGLAVLALTVYVGAPLKAQGTAHEKPVDVVMLSDIHFDPLQDPVKVKALDQAPLSEWKRILDQPASPDRKSRFDAIQAACSAKDAQDSSYALFTSSLAAAKAHAGGRAFVTVSGDLLVHDLDCRYRAAMNLPPAQGDDQSASARFAEKTTKFVIGQLLSAFPKMPVYVALGNNDSRCNHNRLDWEDEFLKASVGGVVAGLRGVNANEKRDAELTFQKAGYYAITMPAPMQNTRLLVVDNIYMMPKFATCGGSSSDHRAEQEQLAWMRQELQKARVRHQHVWVLGHLPPAVNPGGSTSACVDSGKVVQYQSTDALANEMVESGDTISLGIFGHTHMDELHLLRTSTGGIPVKVVASVSPVGGSLPSLTIGSVDPTSATLSDYTVYKASNISGEHTDWSVEYSFDATYGTPSFTAEPLSNLIAHFQSDSAAKSDVTRAYREHFLKDSAGKKMPAKWQGYACAFDHFSADSFKHCACSTP
ncbi:metallophosphoesterase [Terriglobus sp. TAA 43]|uniref:metallophosphoesterase n=1 Tax=Terriglobus sp. TAA 43 TaxID=278961 RepID=UPI0018DE9CF5|nr:metallophosphoesterase [Terriglobus sp. TAA 43]